MRNHVNVQYLKRYLRQKLVLHCKVEYPTMKSALIIGAGPGISLSFGKKLVDAGYRKKYTKFLV
jgi:hypothetical protein